MKQQQQLRGKKKKNNNNCKTATTNVSDFGFTATIFGLTKAATLATVPTHLLFDNIFIEVTHLMELWKKSFTWLSITFSHMLSLFDGKLFAW